MEFMCKCGARWTGKNRAHCGACHVTYGGVASFDRHRKTDGESSTKCLPPESLGLTDNGKGVWVAEWGKDD